MTDSSVVRSVIRYLGLVALVLAVGCLVIFVRVLDASTGRETLDPSVVAMFGSVCTLAGAVIGGLTAMLVSTRSSDTPQAVVGVHGGPVETAEVETADGDA